MEQLNFLNLGVLIC